ncbi:MAG TPA: hypothetical protein VKY19_04880 [Ktedonosporobacter sp.]|nr:hypothetical protein [Ktedonosporobacter sp.]
MSRPSPRKIARQNKKNKRKTLHRKNQKNMHYSSSLLSTFPAESIGAPAAGTNWLGQKLASFLRIRK